MLKNFIKNKKKEVKAINIESIQNIIEGVSNATPDSTASQAKKKQMVKFHNEDQNSEPQSKLVSSSNENNIILSSDIFKSDFTEEIVNLSKKPFNFEDCESMYLSSEADPIVKQIKKDESKSGALEKYNIHSRGMLIEDLCFSSLESLSKNSIIKDSKTTNSQTTINDRKLKIKNHATRLIHIPYTSINTALYFPKSFKQLSALYKILITIYNFNKKRGLSLILIKYKESIERLFKHRLETKHIEQLNYIVEGGFEFIPIKILDNGIICNTFNITIKSELDIDSLLFKYFIECYKGWIIENKIEGEIKRIHPDFNTESLEVPRKCFSGVVAKPVDVELKVIVESKAESIFERIKEKERQRKEAYVAEQHIKVDYEGKIESMFLVTKARAIKLSEIIFKIGGFNCRQNILSLLGNKFILKVIDNEEYLMIK